jgi:sulfonate transport system permease protein
VALLMAGLPVPLLLLAIWSLTARRGWLPDQILPAPGVVLATLREFAASGDLTGATLISLRRVAEGFAVGALAGLAFGSAIGLLSAAAPIRVYSALAGDAVRSESRLSSVPGACQTWGRTRRRS